MADEQRTGRRARIGKILVGFAVLAPSLLVVGVYLVLQGKLYGYHFPGPLWPWAVGDLTLLGIGVLLLRGEDI